MSRELALKYDEERHKIEEELRTLSEFLCAPGMPGINGPLTDEQGYPLPGVDLYRIRQSRQRFHRLNTDYNDLMKRLESELQNYFQHSQEYEETVSNNHQIPVEIGILAVEESLPFAYISEVTEGSPAMIAGFKAQDKIVRFGEIDYRNHQNLQGLIQFVVAHENQEINVHLIRKNAINRDSDMTLKVTPKRWEGNGILGCRFLPFSEQ